MAAGAPVSVTPVPFQEAIRAFERRAGNVVSTDRWDALWHEEHATAFTVARSAGYDIAKDIADEFENRVLKGGETADAFVKNLTPVLQAKGWWGKTVEDDGSVVQLGSAARLRLIYDVNLRVSYSAGAWERAQRTKRALPYIVYEGIDDSRQRPAHHAWMGTCLPVDHPWWDTHWCPCGWRCRCWNRQVTRLEAQEIGITENPPTGPARTFTNKSTGEVVTVPWGIDPGFGYNVGKAALAGRAGSDAAKVMADKLAATPPRVAALPVPAQILADQTREFATWLRSLDLAKPKGALRVVGALSDGVLDFLSADAIGIVPQSGAITVTDHAVAHAMRDSKSAKAPDMATLAALPSLLAEPQAILWDRDKQNLVWVVAGTGDRTTRLVVELDRAERSRDASGRRGSITTNSVVNMQVVPVASLGDRRRYELVEGSVE